MPTCLQLRQFTLVVCHLQDALAAGRQEAAAGLNHAAHEVRAWL